MSHIRARAAATVANLAVGFDILGLALQNPADEVLAQLSNKSGARLVSIEGLGESKVPLSGNTAEVAVNDLLRRIQRPEVGIELQLFKHMPIGSGLGSSAASAAAAVVATNHLLGEPLSRQELVACVQASEASASGSPHADNAAPCVLGGIILISSYSPLKLVSLRVPEDLAVALVHPRIELRTEDARKALQRHVPLATYVTQSGRLASFIVGLERLDYDLLATAIEDVLIEPQRAVLIPGFNEVKAAALGAGALGCSISGSGPSIFALCRGISSARAVSTEMKRSFETLGIEATAYADLINMQGAAVIEERR